MMFERKIPTNNDFSEELPNLENIYKTVQKVIADENLIHRTKPPWQYLSIVRTKWHENC